MSQPSPNPDSSVFTVSQLNQRARQLLEISFASVRVEGEISNLARPSSGHWYFTLKDSGAQIRCAMFRSRTAQLKFQPKEGDQVELRAKVSLYENRGDYQLIVDHMKPAGEGALLLAFQQLKQRLTAEGLFNEERKQPLPTSIGRLALVTSASGAAIHDILTVLNRRWPALRIDLYPTMVQGKEAPQQLIDALYRANRDQRADVILLSRGGGSLEDLWCFNDEGLARAIAASQLPVISAVGHEVDFTIADFVADLRAPTPSAAAELLSPDQQQFKNVINQQQQRLALALRRRLQQQTQQVNQLRQRLRSPQQQLQQQQQRLDQLEIRLHRQQRQQLTAQHGRLIQLQQRLNNQHPARTIQQSKTLLDRLTERLNSGLQRQLQQRKDRLAGQVAMLQSLSPLNVLARGYSISQTAEGRVIQDCNDLQTGDTLVTRLHTGQLHSTITGIEPSPPTSE